MSLIFTHSLGGYPAEVLSEIVSDYNSSQDDFSVELISQNPHDYAAAAKQALIKSPEERPHFTLAPEFMTGAMQHGLKDGRIISAHLLLSKARLADISAIIRETFGTHCLPFNPACGVLYINESLLKQVGIDLNWQPKTLEDLIQVSKTIKQNLNPKIYPLIKELIQLKGPTEEIEKIIYCKLSEFESECNTHLNEDNGQ